MAAAEQRTTTSYPETGLYWHVHHYALVEWCTGYKERVAHIRTTKPDNEIETRLRLFAPVQNVPPQLAKAYVEWAKAYAEWNKAKSDKAWAKSDKAIAKLAKAKANAKWAKVKEVLHLKECPHCPWDGTTIFPQAR
jgi:hypothetical protein